MNKKTWFIGLLIFWLGSWPISFGSSMLAGRMYRTAMNEQFTTSDIAPGGDPVSFSVPLPATMLNLAGILLGMYAFIGWIPALIMYTQLPKEQKKAA